jgi:rubrerythrin
VSRAVDGRFNRTGIATAPDDAAKTIEGACDGTPAPRLDGQALAETRLACGTSSPPVGTLPRPLAVAAAMRSAAQPPVLLDLVGERLAFERTATRLYEALLSRLESVEASTHEDLERIRDEELGHIGLLTRAAEALGGDPTALTPAADVSGVAARGLVDAIADPRASAIEAMQAILVAELVDNDGWLVLADLAARLGHEQLAADFRHAMAEEEEHLARVRAWLTAAIDAEAGLAPEAPPLEEQPPVP